MRKALIIVVDLIVIYASILLSFLILKQGFLLDYANNIDAFYFIAPFIVPIYLVLAYVFGMMALQRKTIGEIVYTIFIVSIAITVTIMATIFFARFEAMSYPRSVVLLGAFFYFVLLCLWRIFVQIVYKRIHGKRPAVVIGSNVSSILERLSTKYASFYDVREVVATYDDSLNDKLRDVTEIFIADDVSEAIREQIVLQSNLFEQKNIYFVPKISDIPVINSKMSRFDDLPTHIVSKMFLNSEERLVKRIMDIVFSLVILVLTLPVIIITAILVKLDGGTIFYKQERLTRGGRVFEIIKFRSMRTDAELSGPQLAKKNDQRITRVGRFIRSTRIDELPQFWNILKGEMSVVGPRPERPFFAEQVSKDLPEFEYRLNVKAGLTGMAQIMGKYNTDFKQKLHYDFYYIQNFSLIKDCLIILQTVKTVLWTENVAGFEMKESEKKMKK